jgi:dihydropyrimidinase
MSYDLVIKNGTVVTASTTFAADVGIKGERIAAVGQDLSGDRVLDASGKLVTPGAVDIHVHMQMPIGDFVSTDDFFSGTVAAAHGGTTAIVDFVERAPGETMVEAIAARRALADPRVVIDYGLHMTIGPAEIDKLDQVPAAVEAGCRSFKLYMAYALCLSDGQLLKALEAIRDAGGVPVVHAENWDLISTLVARNLAAGRTTPHWHPRSRPALMEGEAVGRVINISELVGIPLHIFHVTSPAAVERIRLARQQGLPITGETCPQYLLLTQEVYDRPGVEGALPVCSPPIRDQVAQDSLWLALGRGDLQVVTTDHCPFTRAEKATGLDNYSRIPGGVPSVEMRFPAMYSYGVRSGRISPSQWVNMCCTTPAKLAGFVGKGDIVVGYDADLVVFDPGRQVILNTEHLHEKVDWTPYDGIDVQGWPSATLSRGELIVRDGALLVEPGRGRYARRSGVSGPPAASD